MKACKLKSFSQEVGSSCSENNNYDLFVPHQIREVVYIDEIVLAAKQSKGSRQKVFRQPLAQTILAIICFIWSTGQVVILILREYCKLTRRHYLNEKPSSDRGSHQLRKQRQLTIPDIKRAPGAFHFANMVVLDTAKDHIGRQAIPKATHEVPVSLKLTTPQKILHRRKLTKDSTGRQTGTQYITCTIDRLGNEHSTCT